MNTVLINTSTFAEEDRGPLSALEKAGLSPIKNPHRRKLTEAETIERIEKHQPVGIIAGVEPLTRAVLEKAKNLRCISRVGIGVDTVDLDAAKRLGIPVRNTPEAPVQAVAELTVGMILAQLRHIPASDRGIRAGKWDRPFGGLLKHRTVGIVGLGRIGRAVAACLSGFGCRLIGFDAVQTSHETVKIVPFAELLGASDIVCLHVPGTPETRNMMNRETIGKMKKGAVLVNLSRGEVVDESALVEALENGSLGGACLDTFQEEPYHGPLCRLENVVLTAHIGSYAKEARSQMEREAVENLLKELKR